MTDKPKFKLREPLRAYGILTLALVMLSFIVVYAACVTVLWVVANLLPFRSTRDVLDMVNGDDE